MTANLTRSTLNILISSIQEHYLDLWAMDHAILYLVLRYSAVGVTLLLPAHWALVPSRTLFVFYVLTFCIAFRNYYGESMCEYGAGMFDKGFPPSGRRRCVFVRGPRVWYCCQWRRGACQPFTFLILS